jgi:hypothetical protein
MTVLCAGAHYVHAETPCESAVVNRDAASVEGCLPDRAGLIITALGNYTYTSRDGGTLGGFVRIDKPLGRWLWLEARGRYQAAIQADLLAGLVLSHSHGTGRAWFASKIEDTGALRTTTYQGRSTVIRKDLVLVGGVKLLSGRPDAMPSGMESPRETKAMAALGLQSHTATGFGSHAVIEALVLYGDGLGGVLAWHNSIPPTGGIVFGMEAGWLPSDAIGQAYWAIVELGYSLER